MADRDWNLRGRFIPEGKPDIGIEVIISKPQNVGIPSWEELQALLKEEILASSLDIDATTCMFAYTVPTWIEPHSVERNYITSHVVLERAIRRAGRACGNEVLMDITMVPGMRQAENAEMISTMKRDVTKNEDEMIEMSVKLKDGEGESEVEDENKESETDKNDYGRESETINCEHDNSSDEDMSESGSGSPTPHPTDTQCPSQYYISHNKKDFALFREETEELYYELERPIGNMAQLFAPVVMEALCSVDDGIEPELVFRWMQSRMQGMYRSIERWHREQTSPRAEAESVRMRITPPTPELEATKSESPIPTRILTTIPTISWILLRFRRHSTPEIWAAESGAEIVDFDVSHLEALLVEWDRLLNYCPVASRFAHNPETHIEGVEEGGCPCVDGMIALMAYLDDKILTEDILMRKLVAFALIPAFERSLTQAKQEVPKSAPYIADRILMVAYKNMRKRGAGGHEGEEASVPRVPQARSSRLHTSSSSAEIWRQDVVRQWGEREHDAVAGREMRAGANRGTAAAIQSAGKDDAEIDRGTEREAAGFACKGDWLWTVDR
ncbi:hypothetical protein BC936DRAFT_147927 [Jimgerdemannia flammicorona]|uniref:Uncharacterized protein n=1 Tax=Jimgerdemannia flammicorona TaxID=994334 RepID=A0A433D441_9FUNG|nr:hypothetical protein BC936DRAFT_147927 [Jimgerdemannia flammicorona]